MGFVIFTRSNDFVLNVLDIESEQILKSYQIFQSKIIKLLNCDKIVVAVDRNNLILILHG